MERSDAVADVEFGHVRADGVDVAGHVVAGVLGLGLLVGTLAFGHVGGDDRVFPVLGVRAGDDIADDDLRGAGRWEWGVDELGFKGGGGGVDGDEDFFHFGLWGGGLVEPCDGERRGGLIEWAYRSAM
jgi:hypothetical protein